MDLRNLIVDLLGGSCLMSIYQRYVDGFFGQWRISDEKYRIPATTNFNPYKNILIYIPGTINNCTNNSSPSKSIKRLF